MNTFTCCKALFKVYTYPTSLKATFSVTYHILEGFPRSLQVIQVGSAGLHRRVIQLLYGCSAYSAMTLLYNNTVSDGFSDICLCGTSLARMC